MVKKLFKAVLILLVAILTNSILSNNLLAASSGSYISTNIGEETVSSFTNFKALDQILPANTSITYQFSSNIDNYQTWSNEQACIWIIDLTKITSLNNAKFIKVKINMYSSSSDIPSLSGFEVTYQTTTNSSSSNQATGTNQVSSAINVNTSANFTDSSSQSSSSSNTSTSTSSSSSNSESSSANNASNDTKTKTISLSQNKTDQINLVSTGGNLWVNIIIALAITGALSLILFYHNIRFADENRNKL